MEDKVFFNMRDDGDQVVIGETLRDKRQVHKEASVYNDSQRNEKGDFNGGKHSLKYRPSIIKTSFNQSL